MMKYLMTLLVMLLAMPASATERLLFGVNTGVPARDEQRDLADKYKPLADYLVYGSETPGQARGESELICFGAAPEKRCF